MQPKIKPLVVMALLTVGHIPIASSDNYYEPVKTALQVDLTSLPPIVDKKFNSAHELTVGDLHGNVMKLLYVLITEGVLQLAPAATEQQELYTELYDIYETGMDFSEGTRISISKPNKKQVARFKEIIENAEIIASNATIVRLLGDDLADRGGSDYFTLLVITKLLNTNAVKLRILFSNHGDWALKVYEELFAGKNYCDFKRRFKQKTKRKFIVSRTGEGSMLVEGDFNWQCSSMHGLFYLLDKSLIDFEEAKDLYTNYKEQLQLFDYSIIRNNSLLIFTHAPIDFSDIKKLASYYEVLPDVDLNVNTAVSVIDAINASIKPKITDKISVIPELQAGALINRFIWMRRKVHKPYQMEDSIWFVHGHDGPLESPAGFINLDSNVGKFNITRGQLPVLLHEVTEEHTYA